ncbi:MAG: hypothetical protein ACK5T0_05450 [Vampirovibrionales bacterium]
MNGTVIVFSLFIAGLAWAGVLFLKDRYSHRIFWKGVIQLTGIVWIGLPFAGVTTIFKQYFGDDAGVIMPTILGLIGWFVCSQYSSEKKRNKKLLLRMAKEFRFHLSPHLKLCNSCEDGSIFPELISYGPYLINSETKQTIEAVNWRCTNDNCSFEKEEVFHLTNN